MIMVQGDSGIERITDLMGKQVATTRGTTAHVMLFNVVKSVAMDQDAVELINMDMAAVVQRLHRPGGARGGAVAAL